MFIALIYHWNAFNIFNQIRSESTRLLVSTMVSSKEVLPESSFIGVLPNVQYSSSSSRLHLVLTLAIAIIVIPAIFRLWKFIASPIREIPGPLLNKLTSLPLKLAIVGGRSHQFTSALHERYGPIVVLAPDMLSVSDEHEIKRIILLEDWPKSQAVYGNFRQDPERPTLIAFTDKKAYAQRKRMISSMFGIKYIRSMQPLMLKCIDVAVKQLEELCDGQKDSAAEVDIQHLVQSLAVDIIGITTFGQSFDVVETGSHPLPEQLKKALKLSGLLQFMPWIRKIPFLPTRDPYVDSFTSQIIARREATLKSAPQDLLQKLVEACDDSTGSIFRHSDVQDEAVILITAGSETTANAELFTLMMLTKHPDKLAKVYQEVDEWYPDLDRPADCEYSFNGMTYLQACIDETMRIFPGQATGSPRETTREENVLGFRIPKGTTVFPSTAPAQLDKRVWQNAKEFIPERWLDIKTTEAAYYPFSAGSRVCIGKHFALQEMHLTLVSLLRRFRFEYLPGQEEETMFRVAQQLKAHKYLMKIKRRERRL